MPPLLLVKALFMGVVEGLTEFLPISSTGHLILAGEFIGFTGEFAKTFEIFIQLGAILAVVWIYRGKILSLVKRLPSDNAARRFFAAVMIAFFPAAIVGLAVHKFIKLYLFTPVTVAMALVAGGIMILLIERGKRTVSVEDMEGTPAKQALAVGLAQILALFPGVSRSGATIMGGVMAGMSRTAATEFSFFLAIPTMLAATVYDLSKGVSTMTAGDGILLAAGFVSAFFSALWVVRWLIRFVSGHSFVSFAWYRIIFGGILLLYYFSR